MGAGERDLFFALFFEAGRDEVVGFVDRIAELEQLQVFRIDHARFGEEFPVESLLPEVGIEDDNRHLLRVLIGLDEREHFEGIDICGIATDYCVYETTKDLISFYPAKQVRIVTNCLAAVDDNDTKLADLMRENGIAGIEF